MTRRATPQDLPAIADLARQLGYPDGGRHLAEICARDNHAVFVALESNRVVGFIHVCTMLSLDSEPHGEIRSLVVDEAHRGRRIGEQLVSEAEKWTRSRSLGRIRVRSNVIRDRARGFYERLGYAVTKAQNVFDKSLQ